jgi:hypothetical protein
MHRIIEADDLEVGQYVLIVEYRRPSGDGESGMSEIETLVLQSLSETMPPIGSLVAVRAISLPTVVCESLMVKKCDRRPLVFDARVVRFAKATDEVVEAVSRIVGFKAR